MAVSDSEPTDAQKSQIPPVLRQFVRENCEGVSNIQRYSTKNELGNRGYKITCENAMFYDLPPRFTVVASNLTPGGRMIIHIRDE